MTEEPRPFTTQRFFEEIVPALLQERQASSALPEIVATFDIVGDNKRSWTIRCTGGKAVIEPQDAQDAQLRMIVSDRALEDILLGKLDAETALSSHAMTIQGKASLLPRLAFLFAQPKTIRQGYSPKGVQP